MQHIDLILAFGLGTVIGAINYSFLWRTLERLPRTAHPAASLAASAALRMLVVLGGFYLLSGSGPALLLCLLGLLGARHAALRRHLAGHM